MRRAAEVSTDKSCGPVRRGFSVAFPDGERGRLDEIGAADGTVELLVEAAASGRLVAVDAADVAATAGLEAAGGIIRMPSRHSSRIAGPPEEAS